MKTSFKRFFSEKVSGSPEKFVILLPGGFKPPTLGHYELIKKYSEHPSVEKVFVLIGPVERDGFTREQSLQAFDLYGINSLSDVEVISTDTDNPLEACFDFITENSRSKEFSGLTFGIGASDKGKDQARSERLPKYFAKNPMKLPSGVKVGIPPIISSVSAASGKPVSATELRAAIFVKDSKTIKRLIPKHVKVEDFLKIYSE